ncbi:hypothetical protein IW138_004373, partial [Coemansia sp. RSA 986]
FSLASLPLQHGANCETDPSFSHSSLLSDRQNHDRIEQTAAARPIQKTEQHRRNMDSAMVANLSLKDPADSQQSDSPLSTMSDAAMDNHREATGTPSDSETSFVPSERALQESHNSSSSPETEHQAENSLRRSSRKRTQRTMLSVEIQPLEMPSSQPATPTTGSRSGRSSRSNRSSGNNRSKAGNSQNNTANGRSLSSNNSAQQQRKRRHTSNASGSKSSSSSPGEASIDSDLDFEVSIFTGGTAVPHAFASLEPAHTCFMCNKAIYGDTAAVNAHIDQCLAESAGESPNNGTNDADDEGPMVAYEWGGQTRIRATAMLEGGVVAAGLGFGSSSAYKDNDDDVDVDEQDETNYGPSQYTDNDLILADGSKNARRAGRGGGQQRGSGHRHQPSGPQFEEYAVAGDSPAHPTEQSQPPPPPHEPSNAPAPQHLSSSFSPSDGGNASAASQLVIDALKERLKNQERLLQSVQKCLICLDPYDKPCTSINCWHVYCEKCWLHTLGTKKLCPQCLQITQPTDLRRIYL